MPLPLVILAISLLVPFDCLYAIAPNLLSSVQTELQNLHIAHGDPIPTTCPPGYASSPPSWLTKKIGKFGLASLQDRIDRKLDVGLTCHAESEGKFIEYFKLSGRKGDDSVARTEIRLGKRVECNVEEMKKVNGGDLKSSAEPGQRLEAGYSFLSNGSRIQVPMIAQ